MDLYAGKSWLGGDVAGHPQGRGEEGLGAWVLTLELPGPWIWASWQPLELCEHFSPV